MCSTVATNCFLRSVIINEELMYAGHIIFFRVPGEKATWRICTYTLIKYYKKDITFFDLCSRPFEILEKCDEKLWQVPKNNF